MNILFQRHIPALHEERGERRREKHPADDTDRIVVDFKTEEDDPPLVRAEGDGEQRTCHSSSY